MFKPGDKAVITAQGELDSHFKKDTVVTIDEVCDTPYFRGFCYLVEDRGDGLYSPEDLAPYEGDSPKAKQAEAPRKYVDTIHFEALTLIREAFEEFNAKLLNWNGGWLEAGQIDVTIEGDPYARVFYCDGDVLVEPLFDIVRDINDR